MQINGLTTPIFDLKPAQPKEIAIAEPNLNTSQEIEIIQPPISSIQTLTKESEEKDRLERQINPQNPNNSSRNSTQRELDNRAEITPLYNANEAKQKYEATSRAPSQPQNQSEAIFFEA
tara:strand:- start:158 stop:514 length:357 start_codon:yes stop_codon:yes gene_type:complete